MTTVTGSQSNNRQQSNRHLEERDLADYGFARFRDQIFDAVLGLWRRRREGGWTQKIVADKIGRDPGWVSRTLSSPGNWTLKTAGELIQALDGEAEIRVLALEDAPTTPSNYDAYEGYIREKGKVGIGGQMPVFIKVQANGLQHTMSINNKTVALAPIGVSA